MKKATVRLIGGLGNQLHGYAFGRAIAAHNKAILEVDAESGYWSDPYKRQYLLDAFPHLCVKRKKLPGSALGRLLFKSKIRVGVVVSAKLPLSLRPFVCEEHPRHYQEEVHRANYRINPYFLGYWATYRYYRDISADLRRELVPPSPDHPAALHILDRIKAARSCSIHWRFYTEEVGVPHPSLTEFYRNAIRMVEDRHPGIQFFLFSDDPSLARKELRSLARDNVTFVDIPDANGNAHSLMDFHLMYSCDHAIVGDSTFSWWAAWLSDRENKTIVAPRGLSPWGDDWLPPQWSAIDVKGWEEPS